MASDTSFTELSTHDVSRVATVAVKVVRCLPLMHLARDVGVTLGAALALGLLRWIGFMGVVTELTVVEAPMNLARADKLPSHAYKLA